MLLLIQAAAQQLPPINVTVQSPPGMAEWLKAAISAGIGALFGMAGNIGMEYLRPFIFKTKMTKQLAMELANNLLMMGVLENLLDHVGKGGKLYISDPDAFLRTVVCAMHGDHYEHYLEKYPSELRDITGSKGLINFYQSVTALKDVTAEPHLFTNTSIVLGKQNAKEFLRLHPRAATLDAVALRKIYSDMMIPR